MCSSDTKKAKSVYPAAVASNTAIGPTFYRLSLKFSGAGAAAFAKAVPGQFLEIKVDNLGLPEDAKIPENIRDKSTRNVILRRPFSFVDIKVEGEYTFVDILYCVLGPGTLRMMTLKPGDQVSITGPLGNGFSIVPGKKLALLVAGGMGAPPLQHFASYLAKEHPEIEVDVFVGARSAKDMPFFSIQQAPADDYGNFELPEFKGCGSRSHIATDDGSCGFDGYVPTLLEGWLTHNDINPAETIVYTCGPEIMMEKVAKIAQKHDIDCQVSLERMMACGIGLCQSCAVEIKGPEEGQTIYKLCCQDGPVFDGREVVW